MNRVSQEEFIQRCIAKFGDNRFDYSNTVYTGGKNKIKIKCIKHGFFETVAGNHMNPNRYSSGGCKECVDDNYHICRGGTTPTYKIKCSYCGTTDETKFHLYMIKKAENAHNGAKGMCRVCHKTKDKEYFSANTEKVVARARKYYKKNRPAILAKGKAWRQSPEGKVVKSEQDRRYTQGPARESILENKRKYYQEKGHKSLAKASVKTWYKGELISLRENATLPSTDMKAIERVYKECRALNIKHGKATYAVDHVIPLCRGGAHHQDNLRIITFNENSKKGKSIVPELGGMWADNDLAKEAQKELILAELAENIAPNELEELLKKHYKP